MAIVLTSATVLLLACGAFIVADRAQASRAIEHELASFARMIGTNSAASLTFNDPVAATEALAALRAKPAIVAAVMYTKSGKPFAIYGQPAPAQLLGAVPKPASSANRIEVVRGVFLDGEQIGSIYIASNLSDAAARVRSFAGVAMAILIMSLAVAFLLSWRLERVITRPILDLSIVAQLVTRKRNYSIRVAAPRTEQHDEIGELIIGFNEMLTEIQRRDDALQRHRDELEHQVQTRTNELRGANANLMEAKDLAECVAEINAQLSRQQQMILNAAGEGIVGVDSSGTVTFINPSGAEMFHQPVHQLVGRKLHPLIHRADSGIGGLDDCPMCRPHALSFERTSDTYTFVRRDGTPLPIEFIVSPIIDEAGKRNGVVVTFRDVTERLAVERMKNEFVSTVSHELRTPLTSIRGALGLLASGLLGDVNDRAKRMLSIAVSNTDRLVRLINDILDLERMESGRVELSRETIDANTLMREAIEVVQSIADGAGVALAVEPVEALLNVDRDRIVQTLTNLLGNAVKFSPSGTTVLLSGTAEPGQFRFSVRDHGRGIPADKKDSIFERFRQVDASDSREKGGSGLGLAICRTLVTAHGGRLWVDTSEDQGSTFHFTVPFASTGAAENARPANDGRAIVICTSDPRTAATVVEPIDVCSAPTILVIEDDLDLARVVTESLQGHGVHTIHARNGREAMAACERRVPTLVVLDVVMPEFDGFAVVEWMRTQRTLASVPLLVFSAQEICAADQERLRLGPTAFLTKSRVTLDQFTGRVMTLLNSVHGQETNHAAA